MIEKSEDEEDMVMVQDETETKEVELVRSVSKSEQQNPSFLSTAQRSDEQ